MLPIVYKDKFALDLSGNFKISLCAVLPPIFKENSKKFTCSLDEADYSKKKKALLK